ncbi:MAG TPA: acetate/propionate family kinase [Solirubrobacterales bacterium]|nr:acetate/propionate family kinase [Solirubrobacterales bacterium]
MAGLSDVLVVNAGSTGLKLHVVTAREESRPVESIESVGPGEISAVAHRVVHGGARFRDPVAIDERVRERIFATEPLAPLHNAPCLEGIERARESLPDTPQVAVFDTGFHATIPAETATYAVPREWRERWGLRRYGFHGISVAWSAGRAPELLGRAVDGLRLVVCHLGGGCSLSAVRDGRSLDNTMGFSPLEGVPMATRSGSVDPGALTYLMREKGLDAAQLERALERESGLRGLAGGSGDMLAVERAAGAGDRDAALALDVFAHRVAGAAAAMAASAGGLDALVFTAGVGENSPPTRARVCERLGFLGVELDPDRNAAAEPDGDVAAPGSPVRVLVIRAREELIAARAARALLASP